MYRGSPVDCYGRNVERLLFQRSGESFYAFIRCHSTLDLTFKLEAGSAQGVATDAIYAIYESNVKTDRNEVRGYAAVVSVDDAFSATLRFCDSQVEIDFKSAVFYAVLVHNPDESVNVYLSPPNVAAASPSHSNTAVTKIIPEPYSKQTNNQGDANIILKPESYGYKFLWNGIKDAGNSMGATGMKLEFSNSGNVALKMAARFTYHLSRPPPASSMIAHPFEVELREVEYPSEHPNQRRPGKLIAITKQPFADVELIRPSQICLTLHNKTKLPVWPYVFFFDPEDLSICAPV